MGILEQMMESLPALLNEARAIHAELKVYVMARQNVHENAHTGGTIRFSDWYSADEVAKYLGFSARYVRNIPELELPSRKFGSDTRYRGIDVLRYDGSISFREYDELKQHLNPLTLIKRNERIDAHAATIPSRFKDLQKQTRSKTG